jgi:predicted O-methyltransferase YrrM
LTNDIAQKEGLDLEVVEGFSPGDVKSIVEANFDGPVDFVFIDGLHTNDQQYSDFKACAEVASDRAIIMFHDVVSH